MSTSAQDKNYHKIQYARWGDQYITRIYLTTQLRSLLGISIGVLYFAIIVHLTIIQLIHLSFSFVLLYLLANLLQPIMIFLITPNTRKRLKSKSSTHLDTEVDENIAWKEIVRLPGLLALSLAITFAVVVIIPVTVYLRYIGGTNPTETTQTLMGCVLTATILIALHILLFDQSLTPVRTALFPQGDTKHQIASGIGIQTRQYIINALLVLVSIFLIGSLSYQILTDTMTQNLNVSSLLSTFMIRTLIISFAIILLGIIATSMQSKSIIRPIRLVTQSVISSNESEAIEIAPIVSSDETAELTHRVNQILIQLDNIQKTTRQQIQERTALLERKTNLMQASIQVAHGAASFYNLNTLLSETANLISDRFGFYHAGIFLVDEMGEYAILQAASSDGGKRMLARGHRLAVGRQGIVGAAAYDNRPHVVMNVEKDPDYFKNPDLPETHSEASIPLNIRGKVIGVLDIQSREPEAFTSEDVELIQTMADQIALAIQNARLITESQNALQQLETTTAEGIRRAWSERIRHHSIAYRFTPLETSLYLPSEKKTDFLPPLSGKTNQLDIPIMLRGQIIGTITLQRKSESPWRESDKNTAIEIGNQIGLALENVRLLEEAQNRIAQEQSLSELTTRLSRSLDTDTLLQNVVRELHRLPNVEEVSVFISPAETTASLDETPITEEA